MPSTYSTSDRLEQQADGENSGTWGQKQNNNHTLIEDAISTGAATSIAVGGAVDVTLTANNGLTDQSRLAILRLTGVLTGNINVIIPNTPVNAVKSKWWFVSNETTGAFTLTFKAQGGTGIVVPQGVKNIYWCDGTNVVEGLRFVSPFATDTGASGAAFVVTPGGTTPGALSTGMRIGFKSAHAAAGGASTLNYAGFGTTAFKRVDGSNLQANDFANAQYVEAGYDGTQWVLLTPAQQIPAPGGSGNLLTSNGSVWTSAAPVSVAGPGSATDGNLATFSGVTGKIIQDSGVTVTVLMPTGGIIPFGGAAAPTGWALCDGASVLRAGAFAALFAVIGTAFGSVDGTHFTLPDMRGRSPLGVGTGSGLTARALAAIGGEETHLLTTAESPAHVGHNSGSFVGVAAGTDATAATSANTSSGGGGAHNTMHPFLVLTYIIKT